MANLESSASSLSSTYSQIYTDLAELRESFHRSGRLDDSNAKLDEVSKLFAVYLAYSRKQIPLFPDANSATLIEDLQEAFEQTVRLPQYRLKSGGSIFGTQPALILRQGDEALAKDLVSLVRRCVDTAFAMRSEDRPFDILNEAFGHFVRDNFRGNIEDAQYMTPPEVVEFIVDIALEDMKADQAISGGQKHWTVLDPSCGVGSFLTTLYHRAKGSDWLDTSDLTLLGQDKVERMVRLSTINMELFDVGEHHIFVGNSLESGSELDRLNGQVDFILTNPPFGARFAQEYVSQYCGSNTPFFSSLKRTTSGLDSELLFVDRNMRLLRDGGRMLIVVPDGVVSAKGVAALLRQHLSMTTETLAVVELPSTAFAQAGTRTKTAVLYLRKGRTKRPSPVFMGVAKDLGFQVGTRKGVQIKVPQGTNELPDVFRAYLESRQRTIAKDAEVLKTEPSCVLVPESQVGKSSWTPSHYSARRFEAVSALGGNQDFEMVALRELVDFCGDRRRPEVWKDGSAFISVLHILGDGFIDVASAMSYGPKTPGVLAEPEEVLMSRINPRIPRVCVTPNLGKKILCSSEFEVMKSLAGLDAYGLAYLLQTSIVQNQIQSLTSGTSASHNRIRTAELAEVLIPIAKPGTERAAELHKIYADYRAASEALVSNALGLARLRAKEAELFAPTA